MSRLDNYEAACLASCENGSLNQREGESLWCLRNRDSCWRAYSTRLISLRDFSQSYQAVAKILVESWQKFWTILQPRRLSGDVKRRRFTQNLYKSMKMMFLLSAAMFSSNFDSISSPSSASILPTHISSSSSPRTAKHFRQYSAYMQQFLQNSLKTDHLICPPAKTSSIRSMPSYRLYLYSFRNSKHCLALVRLLKGAFACRLNRRTSSGSIFSRRYLLTSTLGMAMSVGCSSYQGCSCFLVRRCTGNCTSVSICSRDILCLQSVYTGSYFRSLVMQSLAWKLFYCYCYQGALVQFRMACRSFRASLWVQGVSRLSKLTSWQLEACLAYFWRSLSCILTILQKSVELN